MLQWQCNDMVCVATHTHASRFGCYISFRIVHVHNNYIFKTINIFLWIFISDRITCRLWLLPYAVVGRISFFCFARDHKSRSSFSLSSDLDISRTHFVACYADDRWNLAQVKVDNITIAIILGEIDYSDQEEDGTGCLMRKWPLHGNIPEENLISFEIAYSDLRCFSVLCPRNLQNGNFKEIRERGSVLIAQNFLKFRGLIHEAELLRPVIANSDWLESLFRLPTTFPVSLKLTRLLLSSERRYRDFCWTPCMW